MSHEHTIADQCSTTGLLTQWRQKIQATGGSDACKHSRDDTAQILLRVLSCRNYFLLLVLLSDDVHLLRGEEGS